MYLEHVTEQAIQLANSTIHNFSVVNTIIQPNQIPHPGGKGYWCLAQFETIFQWLEIKFTTQNQQPTNILGNFFFTHKVV